MVVLLLGTTPEQSFSELILKGKFSANERGVKKMENGSKTTCVMSHFISEPL
jgi:hypothetical protein